MRVLHLLDHSRPLLSGYAMRSEAILRSQQVIGLEPLALTSPRYLGKACSGTSEEIAGVRYYRCAEATAGVRKIPVAREWAEIQVLTKATTQVIVTTRPDVIHAHSPALNGLVALRVAKQEGIPVVYEVRALWEDAAVDQGKLRKGGVSYRLRRYFENYVAKRVDRLSVICEGLLEEFTSRGIQASKIVVSPNGVDFERFDVSLEERNANKNRIRERYGLGNNLVVGFIGSFYRYEGLDVLLRAVAQLRHELPMLRLLLVGGGEVEAELRHLVMELNLAPYVVFAGTVAPEEVIEHYHATDVMVYPRLSCRLTELTTPLKPLEALVMNIPVIGSDVGGIAELVHAKKKLLFRAGSVESLCEKLRFVVKEKNAVKVLVKTERDVMKKTRSWDVVARKYAELYESLV